MFPVSVFVSPVSRYSKIVVVTLMGGVYNVVGLVLLCTDIPKPSLLAIAELLVVWRYVLQELSFKMYSGLKVSKPSCFSCCLRYNHYSR